MVSYEDVAAAAESLSGVAHRTPVLTSRLLDVRVGAHVYCKCENFQRTGAFKFRGAYHALQRMAEDRKAHGVLAYSSGNHAQAVALASHLLDIPATIIMPADAPSVKREATEAYGAAVIAYDRSEITREELATQLSAERGLPIIPPYDHPHIVAGQGTACRELLQQYPHLDLLLAPCGGGGLLAGTALAARAMAPECRVIGVEPEAANDAALSFRSGRLHTVRDPDTMADGARTPSLGKITFPLIMQHVHDMVTVPEDAILDAMLFLWERLKIVVEPTGALGIAALLSRAVRCRGARIGVILSGGNVDVRHPVRQAHPLPSTASRAAR